MNVHFQHGSTHPHHSHQVQFLLQRVRHLYRTGQEVAQHNTILRSAFAELSTMLDLLQKVEQEFQQQHEIWLDERAELEAEIQRYQDLFTAAPLPYLVTSLDGTIRQANAAAAALLGASEKLLVGRSLALFTPEGQRRTFRSQLAELLQHSGAQQLNIQMQPWEGAPFDAELTMVVARSRDGKPQHLRWQIQDISVCKRTERRLREHIAELEQQLASAMSAQKP
jgi:PAS domain S-box-containing protein